MYRTYNILVSGLVVFENGASGALNAGRHVRFSSLVFVGSAKKNGLKTGKNLMGTLFPAFFDLACFVF